MGSTLFEQDLQESGGIQSSERTPLYAYHGHPFYSPAPADSDAFTRSIHGPVPMYPITARNDSFRFFPDPSGEDIEHLRTHAHSGGSMSALTGHYLHHKVQDNHNAASAVVMPDWYLSSQTVPPMLIPNAPQRLRNPETLPGWIQAPLSTTMITPGPSESESELVAYVPRPKLHQNSYVHATGTKKISRADCPATNLSMTQKKEMVNSQRTRQNETLHTCEWSNCGVSVQLKDMMHHLHRVHGVPRAGTISCRWGGCYEELEVQSIGNHLQASRHLNIRCQCACGKSYSRDDALTRHLSGH